MFGFGRRATLGKDNTSLAELQEMMRHRQPDADGVMRVFPKEIWDDPKVGSMLRELGFDPDDARNIARTPEDYSAMFAASSKRLEGRVEAFNRDMAARHGYCRAAPFFVIDQTIYDGEHGAFLYASMELIAFDDWNVLMLAADERTMQVCGLAGHPGPLQPVTDVMTQLVVGWKTRFESALEAYGVTATMGRGRGITREQFEVEKDAIHREIVDEVSRHKMLIVRELERIQG